MPSDAKKQRDKAKKEKEKAAAAAKRGNAKKATTNDNQELANGTNANNVAEENGEFSKFNFIS